MAMIDGAASLMTAIYGLRAAGKWTDNRGENILDTGAHYYNVYETSDGQYLSIGSIEAKFYAELLRLTGLEREELPHQNNRAEWPALTEKLAAIFKTRTLAEWNELLEGSDICYAPVLNMADAPNHPHNQERDDVCRSRGCPAAGSGPALQPHPERHPAPARQSGRAHGRGPARLGL